MFFSSEEDIFGKSGSNVEGSGLNKCFAPSYTPLAFLEVSEVPFRDFQEIFDTTSRGRTQGNVPPPPLGMPLVKGQVIKPNTSGHTIVVPMSRAG